MKKILMCLVLVIAVALVARTAMAITTQLDAVLDNITLAPTAGQTSVNVFTDYVPDSGDSLWSITGTSGSVATIIVELAGWAGTNDFGIYDATDPTNSVVVFAGSHVAGDQATVSILSDGSVRVVIQPISGGPPTGGDTGVDFASGNLFGFFLDSSQGGTNPSGGTWYSDTSYNSDSLDHMYAYQGKNIDTVQVHPLLSPGLWTNNEYVLAWEDQTAAVADKDYDDFVVMVESVHPVPEPSIIFLLGSLLIGLGLLDRKRYMK